MLNVVSVPVLYDGVFDETLIKDIWSRLDSKDREGYVVRAASTWSYTEFASKLAKFVKAGHVQAKEHWMHGPLVPNQLNCVPKLL